MTADENMIGPGAVFVMLHYPFVRCKATTFDGESAQEIDSWKPGTVDRLLPPYGDSTEDIAHGLGAMTLTVVSVHKPGKYPERVFYTRQWTNPDGTTFGKTNLRMTTTPAFKRKAYRFAYEFRVAEPEAGEIS